MSTEKLHPALTETLEELANLIDDFSPQQINMIPFEGSWTGGQLAQHLIMSNGGFVEMVNGPVTDTERDPEQHVKNLETDFLNFNTKMKSPDFIVPPENSYAKEELLRILEAIKNGAEQAAATLDLTKTCTAFELPVFGFLTRSEALHFMLFHTQRHIYQLKNIYEKVDRVEEVKAR